MRSASGRRSQTFSDVLYVAVEMKAGGKVALPPEHEERGVYVVEGEVKIAGEPLAPLHLAVIPEGRDRRDRSRHLRPRHAARRREDGRRPSHLVELRRELARVDGETPRRAGARERFPPVPGETEFIPLPAS